MYGKRQEYSGGFILWNRVSDGTIQRKRRLESYRNRYQSRERESDYEMDVKDVTPEMFKKEIDFVWASPPCKSFSIAAISSNWEKKSERLRLPKHERAEEGIELVFHTLRIIQAIDPEHWFMENPRGGLRKIIGEPQHNQRREMDGELLVKEQKDANYPGTLTYCQFGDDRMKPTDLWG